ncbi:uncharacterized protein LOC111127287 isoform X1 [Crassostrea virginica]
MRRLMSACCCRNVVITAHLRLIIMILQDFRKVDAVREIISAIGDKICTPVLPELAVAGPCTRKQCVSDGDCRRGRICCLTRNQRCRRCMNPDLQGAASRETGVKIQLIP